MSGQKERTGRGWKKRGTYGEPRLSEMVRLYETIGFEVYLEPFHPLDEPACMDCVKAALEKYKVLYTRQQEDSD
jgi:hypothetical protein